MSKPTLPGVVCAVFLLLLSQTTHAALLSSGDTVYDSNTGLTWLADANLAVTNTFGVTGINTTGAIIGQMTNNTTTNYLNAMNADGGMGYLGFSDWRLPITLLNDPGCSTTNTQVLATPGAS